PVSTTMLVCGSAAFRLDTKGSPEPSGSLRSTTAYSGEFTSISLSAWVLAWLSVTSKPRLCRTRDTTAQKVSSSSISSRVGRGPVTLSVSDMYLFRGNKQWCQGQYNFCARAAVGTIKYPYVPSKPLDGGISEHDAQSVAPPRDLCGKERLSDLVGNVSRQARTPILDLHTQDFIAPGSVQVH